MLTAEGDIEVLGKAADGRDALQQLQGLQPDFIILDANMPVMDGPTTLKHIMIKNPCPVIVMSNLASGDQRSLVNFFNLGAVDFLPKPVKNKNMLVQQQQILSRARSAARAKVQQFKRYQPADAREKMVPMAAGSDRPSLVVFISGPGGYHEMLYVLSNLPGGSNSYFAAFQSLPEEFTASFTKSAGNLARIKTVPVNAKAIVEPGCCYIASLESHVLFNRNDDGFYLSSDDTAERQAPEAKKADDFGYYMSPNATSYSRKGKLKNIDDFIGSAAENFEGPVHVVFLSGAEGIASSSLEALREKGGKIIVQDPSSCMMPHFLEELISKGLADRSVSPEHVVREVSALATKTGMAGFQSK